MLEKEIENNILSFLKEIGILCWKNHSVGIYDVKKKCFRKARNRHQRNGVSDILGVLDDGSFLAIEVKSASGRPTPEQLRFLRDIMDHAGVAFISRSVTQTWDQLKPFLPNSDKHLAIVGKWANIESKGVKRQ